MDNIQMMAIIVNIWVAAMVISRDWITKTIILVVIILHAILFWALTRQKITRLFQ